MIGLKFQEKNHEMSCLKDYCIIQRPPLTAVMHLILVVLWQE